VCWSVLRVCGRGSVLCLALLRDVVIGQGGARMGRVLTFVVGGIAVLVWVTAIFAWLSAHRLDTTPFVLFVGTIVGNGIPGLITLFKTFAVHESVKVVEENTNGKMTAQFEAIEQKIDEKMGGE